MQELWYNTLVNGIREYLLKKVYVMKLRKRLSITGSLLAVLAISSAYGATPVQPMESTESPTVTMDYSTIPELKASIENASPAIVQASINASNGNPTKDKPIYSTVIMSGNRVVGVKTYKSKEEQEKAMLKERKRLDKVTAERRAKRKNETRSDMLKGLTPIPFYPPVSETRELQSEMFSRPFGRQLDLRLVEAVFKLPSHQLQAGDPQFEIAKLMYQDLTNKKFDE